MIHPALESGNIAVVTGAATGIGRAMSQKFAAMGLKVCLIDKNESALDRTVRSLDGEGFGHVGDVSRIDDLERAAEAIRTRFGDAPAVLVNNAVLRIGDDIDGPIDDWRQALDVNFFGVVNGVRTFKDAMIARDKPGIIVNLGSKQGITNPPGFTIYNVAKSAIKTYTEGLEHALRQNTDRKISAHLLVPGWTTRDTEEAKPGAWTPEQTVDYFLEHCTLGEFYIICPDNEVSEEMDRDRMLWAAYDLIDRRPPLSRWHADWKSKFDSWVDERRSRK